MLPCCSCFPPTTTDRTTEYEMAAVGLKRPGEDEPLEGAAGRETKKLKSRFQDEDAPQDGDEAVEQLSSSQIKEMMLNAQRMIEERKRSILGAASNMGSVLSAMNTVASMVTTTSSSLPKPPVASAADERARKIAELQAQIKSKLTTSTLATLNLSLPKAAAPGAGGAAATATATTTAAAAAADEVKPSPLILNSEGRTVDALGREVQLSLHTPTLKANIRAKKREVLKSHMHGHKGGPAAGRDELAAATDSRFFDPRVNVKAAVRTKRSFHFHEQGKFQQVASRMRMKAQLDKLQSEISQIARKTGINSVTALALVAPRPGDAKEEEGVPEIEWWDSVILKTRAYETAEGQANLHSDKINNLIEHPIQMRPPIDPSSAEAYLPVFLTKKERKKLRRTNRRETWKEKQEKIRLGLEPAPQAKVRISNLMRVLGNEAIQDPTKIEAHVREQMAKRLQTHQEANAARKLTAEQVRDKKDKKLQEDTSNGVHVVIYRIRDLSNLSKKFKIETNAKQLFMTGCAVLFKDVNVVVVEGGPKQQKKYRRLMMNRVRWEEDAVKHKAVEGAADVRNSCSLVWEGTTKQRNFHGDFIFKLCPSEIAARDHFRKHGVEHYWDLAYSSAVLEDTEEK